MQTGWGPDLATRVARRAKERIMEDRLVRCMLSEFVGQLPDEEKYLHDVARQLHDATPYAKSHKLDELDAGTVAAWRKAAAEAVRMTRWYWLDGSDQQIADAVRPLLFDAALEGSAELAAARELNDRTERMIRDSERAVRGATCWKVATVILSIAVLFLITILKGLL